jgi:glycosyltransferase involved in cell wall biosynthesis
MKILIISNIAPFLMGGTEIQASKLAERFMAMGHQVLIMGTMVPTVMRQPCDYRLRTVHIPTLAINRLTRAISYALCLAGLLFLYRTQFDIIYCRFVKDAAITVGLLRWLRVLRVPVVACAEGTGATGDVAFLSRLPFGRFLVRILNKALSAINIISPAIEQELASLGFDAARFSRIPNGIEIPHAYKQAIALAPWHSLIFVGRVTQQKGLPYLLYALQQLIHAGTPVRLTIIGAGAELGNLRRAVKDFDIESRVTFLGEVPNERIAEHLLTHDIFVLPSLYEGFGVAVVEAMAAGLPVIVTRCGGPEFFVDDTFGRICEPGNVQSLQAAILELLSMRREDLLKMGARARRKAVATYDMATIARKHVELFQHCFKKSCSVR